MSFVTSRFIFVFLLVVNAVILSRSRYGQVSDVSLLHGENSLVKRVSLEWRNLALTTEEPPADECRPIAFPYSLQCAHVETQCPSPGTFLSINYLRDYFCTKPQLRSFAFVGLIIWLIFLFSTLGISASDFFTPNLATIAQLLGLDENVAGVTFLAFGNGSPDVFSTFSAMRANSGSLAIGELLGAASFIVSCVVGSMCIIKPFEVNRSHFLRDVGFFTVAVTLLLVILWDSHIRAWEAAIMIVLYLIYVTYVVVGTWWGRRCSMRRRNESLARSEYADDPTLQQEPYRDDPTSPPPRLTVPQPPSQRVRAISAPGPLRLQTDLPARPHSRSPSPSSSYSHMPSFSLVGALEFRQVVTSLRHEAASSSLNMFESQTPYAGGHYHSHSRSRPRTPNREIDPWDSTLGLPLNERPPQLLVTPAASNEAEEIHENGRYVDDASPSTMTASLPSIARTVSDTETDSQTYVSSPPTGMLYILGEIYHTLFPSLHRFRSQSVLGKVASVFAAPAVMMLTLTLPVVVTPYGHSHHSLEKTLGSDADLIDFEEEGIERVLIAEEEVQEDMHGVTFNKWLTAAQCVLGPLFCVGVLFSGTSQLLWLLLAAGITGFAAAILVAVFAEKGEHPTFRMTRCSMGFFVAVVWIMAIADEVVNVLQTFGFIFGLSDAIIGLTIFAVGNSLADLVANMSVAVFAPIMGFSACFGGPMLNILLGVGISGMYITSHTSEPYELHFGTTLFVCTIGLITLLVTTLIVVPYNGYFLSRPWGIFLILSYMTIMVINVVVELKA
ncbi:Sodium/calcium exchanger protein-domain-containing protein [Armillaria luteobubalina]|uniref:Sodium/calcium exchanger protein-domain-containing protein n=1 Tax=Armillaria luteobubalina TaxID=153913 RepID=A0AA39QEL6_9AGAR|nr:Sodium/calcium exchanger protein-domain-containing protein [Armillaria luteobubalina]